MAKENFNIEEYVTTGVTYLGLDWIETCAWKDDEELSDEQMDELFDWIEERDITVTVNIKLRHPEA